MTEEIKTQSEETVKIDGEDYLADSVTEEGARYVRTIINGRAEIQRIQAQFEILDYAVREAQTALATEKEKFTKV